MESWKRESSMDSRLINIEIMFYYKTTLSFLCNHHSNQWFRQVSLTDAKYSGYNFNEQNIYIISKYFLQNYLLITKEKIVTLQGRSLVDTT